MSGTLPLSLCEREQLLTSLRVIRDAGEGVIRCQEVRTARGQAGLEDRKVRRYEGRLFTVKSLSSFPPTLLSSDNPLPQSLPQGREAEKHAAFTLAEGATHVVHFDDIRRAAFTLAEVLITLGIIGVVAAMTMPSVIGHYKKQETISKLKKAYTSINQALRMSEIDNGEYEYWDEGFGLGAEQYLPKYWLPYFNVLKICNTYSVIIKMYIHGLG